MQVRFSRRAVRDLEEIADYVARDRPRAAMALVGRLRKAASDIAYGPLAHPLWMDLPDLGLRKRVSGPYLIFYRVERDTVFIARIVHGSRNIRAIFTADLSPPDAPS